MLQCCRAYCGMENSVRIMKDAETRKSKSIPILSAVCVCVVALMGLTWYVVRGRYTIYDVQSSGGVGVENPGVSLDVVELDNNIFSFGYSIPSRLAIRVQTPAMLFWLRSLNDLRGSVGIYTTKGALKYARLITSKTAYYAGISQAIEVYALSDLSVDSKGIDIVQPQPGDPAVLSDNNYQADGFTRAVVTSSGDAYHIHRWVCVFNQGVARAIEYWDETVHSDGAYSRQVLISKPPPTKHGEVWWGPVRK